METLQSQVIDLRDDHMPVGAREQRDPAAYSRWLMPLKVGLVVADILALSALFVGLSTAEYGRRWPQEWDQVLPEWSILVPLTILLVPMAWRTLGMYRLAITPGWRVAAIQAAKATIVVMLPVLGGLFLLNSDDVSRQLVILLTVGIYFEALLSRPVLRKLIGRRRRSGGRTRVLVVGGGPAAARFVNRARASVAIGLEPVGYLSDSSAPVADLPLLGGIDDLRSAMRATVVDEVVICMPLTAWRRIQEVMWVAAEQGKRVHVPMALFRLPSARVQADQVHGIPTLSVARVPDGLMVPTVKRLVDVVGALLLLLLSAPLVAVVSVAIRLEDRGPVMFAQRRVGLHGRAFTLLKLRSMVIDAEERLAEVRHLNERDGAQFKASHDPRITRVGRFIRRTSIDELPQLWNVLRGEMSLVGPRPALPREVALYSPAQRRRLSVRPGLTGLWQVSGREDASWEQCVAMDLEYIDSWSLRDDAVLLARTVQAVVSASGK